VKMCQTDNSNTIMKCAWNVR